MRIVLGFLRADAGQTTLERPRHARRGRAGPGATCPRSAASTCGCRSSSSWSSSDPSTAVTPRGPDGSPRLAGPVPDRRARGPEGREPVQGQSAEGPVHRDGPPRPRRPAHGRAVRRPRSDQRRAPQGRLPRAAGPGQDAGLQHPPARPGRGAVRHGRDHRPRPDRHVRADPRRQALDRSPGRPRDDLQSDGDIDWLRSLPHVTVTRPGQDYTEVRVDAGGGSAVGPAGGDVHGRATCFASRSPTRRSRRSSSSVSARSTSRRRRSPPGRSGHERRSRNIVAVARREYTVRVRTRSFVLGTLVLLVAVLADRVRPDHHPRDRPVRTSSGIAVHVGATASHERSGGDPDDAPERHDRHRASRTRTSSPTSWSPPSPISPPLDRRSSPATTRPSSRSDARLDGDLDFTLYTNDNATGRTAGLVRRASTAIAIGDRLARLGVQPADQAGLFAPTEFGVAWPDPGPDRTDTRDDRR